MSLRFLGEIRRVTERSANTVATVDLEGSSLLTGVAVVGNDLYFTRASFAGDGWLYSVPLDARDATPSRVATVPEGFPNGWC